MKFELPKESRNQLIRLAKLIKKGFAKWENLPKKSRNATAGIAFTVSGIIFPKILFVGVISSFFIGRHMYLDGEVEDAVSEIIVVEKDNSEDFGHP